MSEGSERMKFVKENMKQILLIIVFTALLIFALVNFEVLLALLGGLYRILSPFLAGFCVAFIMNELLKALEKLWDRLGAHGKRRRSEAFRRKAKRPVCLALSVILVLGMISAMFLIIIPEIKSTITLISDSMPEYVQETEAWIARVSDFLRAHGIDVPKYDIDIAKIADRITKSLSNMGASLFNMTVNATTSIVSSIYDVLLSFVFAIYLLVQKEKLISQGQRILYAILPDKHYERLTGILRLSNHTFSSFVSGQLTEAVILGVLCFIGMLLFRMPYAAAASILVGFTALIPLLGSFIGTGIGAFLILFVDPPKALGFILFIIVLQQLEGNLIYPKVVGKSVGLPGIWVLVSVTVGGDAFGVMGMLVGVPICSVAYTLAREFIRHRVERKQQRVREGDNKKLDKQKG